MPGPDDFGTWALCCWTCGTAEVADGWDAYRAVSRRHPYPGHKTGIREPENIPPHFAVHGLPGDAKVRPAAQHEAGGGAQ